MSTVRVVAVDPYVLGEQDLEDICNMAKKAVVLADLNPNDFWCRPKIREIILRTRRVVEVVFIGSLDGNPWDEAVKELMYERLARTVTFDSLYPRLYFRLPMPLCGALTLMRRNEQDPAHPQICQIRVGDGTDTDVADAYGAAIDAIEPMLKTAGFPLR